MSIYTRFAEVEIIAKHGEHKPPYFPHPSQLVSVRYKGEFGPSAKSFFWRDFLRADDGANEIDAAIAAAPMIELPLADLKAAFKKAE